LSQSKEAVNSLLKHGPKRNADVELLTIVEPDFQRYLLVIAEAAPKNKSTFCAAC
jgi:hypothetical protein